MTQTHDVTESLPQMSRRGSNMNLHCHQPKTQTFWLHLESSRERTLQVNFYMKARLKTFSRSISLGPSQGPFAAGYMEERDVEDIFWHPKLPNLMYPGVYKNPKVTCSGQKRTVRVHGDLRKICPLWWRIQRCLLFKTVCGDAVYLIRRVPRLWVRYLVEQGTRPPPQHLSRCHRTV